MVRLAYSAQGDGDPLVILHGLFGSSTNWRAHARRLQDRHRVLLVDLRNHGDSPHVAGMRYPELASDVLELLDRLGETQVTLLGHSMGGKTAMQTALAAPATVRKLCVIDIAPVAYQHDHDGLLSAMKRLDLSALERRQHADAALAAEVPDPALRGFLLQNLVRTADGFAWRINLAAIEMGMHDLLDFPAASTTPGSGYAGPCLFVYGGRSTYVRPEHHREIRRRFPSATLAEVADAGHWLHAEQPAALARVLDEFLAG